MCDFTMTINGYTFTVSPAKDAKGVPVKDLPAVTPEQVAQALLHTTNAAISLVVSAPKATPAVAAATAPKV